ncbi:MAG: helix-turn-helix domain-containing protein [Candidatus Faecivicinus sp.]
MEEQIAAVQRMQDYIEAHLNGEITPAGLARAAGYSPWHARRLFAVYTGLAPAEYVRKLRLSKSALKLRDERCRIADVAFEMGFGSVDGYQRAFRRAFGCNPREFAAHPTPIGLFTPYGVQYGKSERSGSMENSRTVFVQTVERPARRALIKRGVKATEYFEYCEEVGCDVWGVLLSVRSPWGEPVCLWLPEALRRPGTSEYVQGVELEEDYDGGVPEGFEVIDLPASTYLRFQGEPFAEEDYANAICALQEAVKKLDPRTMGWRWNGDAPRIQLAPIGARGYVELWPVCPDR